MFWAPLLLTVGAAASVPKRLSPAEIAPYPPMQWHSWGLFTHEDLVTQANMEEMADALVESGMAAAGYATVNAAGTVAAAVTAAIAVTGAGTGAGATATCCESGTAPQPRRRGGAAAARKRIAGKKTSRRRRHRIVAGATRAALVRGARGALAAQVEPSRCRRRHCRHCESGVRRRDAQPLGDLERAAARKRVAVAAAAAAAATAAAARVPAAAHAALRRPEPGRRSRSKHPELLVLDH